MYARGVRKRIRADHGLVGLHHKTGGLADHATGRQNVLGLYAQRQTEIIFAGFHRHDDFFERTVTGAFAQTVDGALYLTGAADLHTGQRIGHGHAQVVMAMHRPDGFV